MNNLYRARKKTIREALDDIDTFMTKMELLEGKGYSYSIDIERITNQEFKWLVNLRVRKDEKELRPVVSVT